MKQTKLIKPVEKKPLKKKAYYVSEVDCEAGIAVIASSAKEAKKLGYANMASDGWEDIEWINVRTTYHKEINVDKYPFGILKDSIEALKLGIYGYIECEKCPICKEEENTLYNENGVVGCSDCVGEKND